jgi:glycosyltransferase involved in cell wall biosynthesis
VPDDIAISFVVIAYNEATNIASTLDAIMRLDEIGGYEIVVVDDGSRDRTAEIVARLAEQHPQIHLIRLERNSGRGYARRRGIGEARGALLATVDADIILPADWLVRVRAAIRDHDAVGGTAVPDGDVSYLYKRFRLEPRAVSHTTTVTGSNALYRRSVFAVVGFDPELREGEDSALNHSMGQAGLSCLTVPGLLVRHEEDKSLAVSVRWLFEIGCGATRQLFALRRLRGPDLVAIVFVGVVGLCCFLLARGYALAAVLLPVCFVLTAAAQHVRSRFYLPVPRWGRALEAIAVDSVLLTAYLTGRVAGLAAVRRGAGRGGHAAPGDQSLSSTSGSALL